MNVVGALAHSRVDLRIVFIVHTHTDKPLCLHAYSEAENDFALEDFLHCSFPLPSRHLGMQNDE